MDDVLSYLGIQEIAPPLEEGKAVPLARQLGGLSGLAVYWRSIVAAHGALFFLGRSGTRKELCVLYADEGPALDSFRHAASVTYGGCHAASVTYGGCHAASVTYGGYGGCHAASVTYGGYGGCHAASVTYEGHVCDVTVAGSALRLCRCPTTYANAVALHQALPFTRPRTLGLQTSAGCGDRLGLATPGHVRAIRKTRVAPIFTQQSIREMERTQRTPEDVVSDGTWGVFQEGWREGYGADADHLKDAAAIDRCVAAGFTFYTLDPRDHVDNAAHTDDLSVLQCKVAALPWDRLADNEAAMRERYLRTFPVEGGYAVRFEEEALLRAAAKYGRALAHVAAMYRHLGRAMGSTPFELEVSVDETDTTTSPEEHFFIASELQRMGVRWVSLAPRYVGRFEKGVDYIGDLDAFDAAVARHAAIARCCGPYKLSIHSGSDKFRIYPIMARHTRGLVHLKTAGTSYLEALRAIAGIDPPLFRDILDLAFERYDEDKATYHVSADPSLAPRSADLADAGLPGVLDHFHARQMLHVTFGSVLTAQDASGACLFRDRFFDALRSDEEAYYRALEAHFDRHLEAFREIGKGRGHVS